MGNDGPGKGKESRTWGMMAQASCFWTKLRGKKSEADKANELAYTSDGGWTDTTEGR